MMRNGRAVINAHERGRRVTEVRLVQRMLIALGLLLVVGAVVGSAMSLDTALGLFSGGVDPHIPYSDVGVAQLKEAIAAFETAIGVPPDFDYTRELAYMSLPVPAAKHDLVNKLAQCYYVLGNVFSTDTADVKAAFIRGKLWGLKSLRMDTKFATIEKKQGFIAAIGQETDVAALYWTCANWGSVDEYDKLGAIERNDPPKLLALIDRALAVDDSYMLYGAYRVLAGFWGGFPKIPFIKYHQDLPRVLSYICHVVDAPDYCSGQECRPDPRCNEYLENRRIFVEYYLIPKRLWDEAARVLTEIISAPIGNDYPLYNAFSKHEARALLSDVEKHR